jgi:sugar lactone lactonase YvrE
MQTKHRRQILALIWVLGARTAAALPVGSSCTISTVAGTGSPGFSGDGGPALLATLSQASGIGFDALGNLYVADEGNNRIRKVDLSGGMTTVAGTGAYGFSGDGGSSALAALANPKSVRADAAGNLYILDSGNDRVRKVNALGVISTLAGNGSQGFSGDGGLAPMASIGQADGLALDAAQTHLYIADTTNNRVRVVNLSSGIITTVAGTGSAGFSGDGASAVLARLNGPEGVFVDGANNLFIADTLNQRIREVSPAGIISTVVGSGAIGDAGDGGPALLAALSGPQAVQLDAFGTLFIADTGNSLIRKVSSGGIISTLSGAGSSLGDGGPASGAQLNGPWDLAFDASGNLFVSDKYQYRVRRILACGDPASPTPTATMTPSASASVTFSSTGTLTPSPSATSTVSASSSATPSFSATATLTPSVSVSATSTTDSTSSLTPPSTTPTSSPSASSSLTPSLSATATLTSSVSVSATPSTDSTSSLTPPSTTPTSSPSASSSATPSGTPSVTPDPTAGGSGSLVTGLCPINTVAGDGNPGVGGDGGPATTAEFNQVGGVSFDFAGNLLLADTGNNRIRRVSGGSITTVAGTGSYGFSGDGAPAAKAQLANPQNVAADVAGVVYIADTGNNRIRKITVTGLIFTIAGNGIQGYAGNGGQATFAEINQPAGLTVDPAGVSLYIADTGNNVIRKVDLASGFISTVAGTGAAGFNGDGIMATAAELNGPTGVSVDGNGNFYIADSLNDRIRKVSSTGVISTVAGNGFSGFSGDGGPATSATLAHPQSPVVDRFGDLFMADLYNNRVRKVDPSGTISTIAGGGFSLGDGGPASACKFNGPWDLALDSGGNLFVSDKYQYRVREILACATGGLSCGACLSTSSAHLGGPKNPGQASPTAVLLAAPNPAGQWLKLYWEQSVAGSAEISIFNVVGDQVWPSSGPFYLSPELPAGRQNLKIDLSALASGVYIVRESMANGGAQPHFLKIAVTK